MHKTCKIGFKTRKPVKSVKPEARTITTKNRDRLRHACLLQGFVGGVVNFSVQGSSDPYLVGLYFTKVKLGSPPREFNVQIDTGSDIVMSCGSAAIPATTARILVALE
uniref:Peptidase A1 domain-containing protein n=1 Tax=Populus trichocarpa TaxID=3694 RepID=A0A2K1Y917_POPTR